MQTATELLDTIKFIAGAILGASGLWGYSKIRNKAEANKLNSEALALLEKAKAESEKILAEARNCDVGALRQVVEQLQDESERQSAIIKSQSKCLEELKTQRISDLKRIAELEVKGVKDAEEIRKLKESLYIANVEICKLRERLKKNGINPDLDERRLI